MALLALWNPNIQFLKTDGSINAGGKIIVTDHNDAESIPANYSDADGTTLNYSPIVLDALGRATCYIDDGSTYDLYVKDANGATLWTVSEMTTGTETIVVSGGFSVSSNDRSVAVTFSVNSDGVTNYDLSIQKEIDRATEAEKGLSDSIESEKNRAEGVESTLSKSIADETERAKEAEKGLADAIKLDVSDLTTDLGKKADKVANSTSGNFAGLDENGNLTDSGKKASDFATSTQGGKADSAIQGVKLNGASSALTYDSNKVVTIPDAVATGTTGSTNGLMTAADKQKLNGIESGTASPLMDGKASVGNSLKYAREDHVHPSDTSRASASHTHGNIANGGTLQTNDITIANGDKLVVTDSSDSSKVARASIAFDGSTTTQALTKAGTWATFNNYSHPAGSAPSKTGVPTANATPGFGGTFKVNQITTDATSHVSAVTERTITIPNTTASTSEAGLMSAADKQKLNGIASGTASPLMDGKASVGNSLKYAREDHVHPSDTSREDVANKTTVVLGSSDSKYPTDKAVAKFVNSSIATNTANYISNNGEPFTSVEQLEAYSGPVTNNDYAFVTGTNSEGDTYYDRYKATVSGSTVTWALEYRLNNSSFTEAQWSAINSGITSVLVAKIHEHSNKDVLDGITYSDVANWDGKEDAFDVLPTTKGGTGTKAASKSALTSSLINSLSTELSKPVDADYYVSQYQNGGTSNTSFVRKPVSAIWEYIKDKISSVLRLTASDYAGKAATAGTADKAVADNSGNNIVNTYATKTELNAKQNSLTAGDNITIDGSTISSDQVFIATYGNTKFDEIKAAYDAGKICTAFRNDICYYINLIEKNRIRFISQTPNPAFGLLTVFSNDSWETSNSWLQSRLSFDAAPTAGSNNPVTSDGIKSAIDLVNAKGITVKEISGEQVICFE